MSTTLESRRSENAALESLSSARNDLKVIQANDPATTGLLHPLSDFKGFLTSDSAAISSRTSKAMPVASRWI